MTTNVNIKILFIAIWYCCSGFADTVNTGVLVDTRGMVGCTAFLTFFVCWVCCTIFLWWQSGSLNISMTVTDKRCYMPGCCIAVGLYCLLEAINEGGMAKTYAIKTSEPLMTTAIAYFLNEVVSAQQAAAVVVVCSGSTILTTDRINLNSLTGDWRPIYFSFISNFFLSLRTVYSKSVLSVLSPEVLFQQLSLVAWVFLSLVALTEVVSPPPGSDFEFVPLCRCLFSGVAYFCYNLIGFHILRMVSSSSFAVAKELRCVFVYFWAIVYQGLPLSKLSIVGTVLVIFGSVAFGKSTQSAQKTKEEMDPILPVDNIVVDT